VAPIKPLSSEVGFCNSLRRPSSSLKREFAYPRVRDFGGFLTFFALLTSHNNVKILMLQRLIGDSAF
jgi:hypothetical protein